MQHLATLVSRDMHNTMPSYENCKKIFVILTIVLASEVQPTDMVSCIATTLLYNINISLILSCSSNIIYRYQLTEKWTRAVDWTMEWTMGCTAGDTTDF